MKHEDAKRRSEELAKQIKNQSSNNAQSAAFNLMANSKHRDGFPSSGIISKTSEALLPLGGTVIVKHFEARFGVERYQSESREDAERWIANREKAWREQRNGKAAIAEGKRTARVASRLIADYIERKMTVAFSDRQRAALEKASAALSEMEDAFNDEE